MLKKLKENDALKAVNSPQEYRYMKWLRFSLNSIGGWPNTDSYDDNILCTMTVICVIEVILSLTGQFLYVFNNYGKYSFFIIGQTYINCLITIVAVSKSILQCRTKYQKVGKYFINNIHLYHFKDSSEYAMQTHILVHKLSHYYTLYLIILVVVAASMFNIVPLYLNITSGSFKNLHSGNVTLIHSVYFSLPFDYVTDIRGYSTVFFVNLRLSYVAASTFCFSDLFLSLMILHLWGHLKILINELQSISGPKLDRTIYTEEENHEVFLKLRHCIQRHNLIIQFVDKMSNTYDEVVAICYLFYQLTGCLMLLQCSSLELNALTRYGPVTVIAFQQLIQISLIFEVLGYVSDKLPDAVYGIRWECMNTSNRKIVQVLLFKSQKPIQFRVLNMLNIGVQTMASILKSSISYFIMLRTLNKNE